MIGQTGELWPREWGAGITQTGLYFSFPGQRNVTLPDGIYRVAVLAGPGPGCRRACRDKGGRRRWTSGARQRGPGGSGADGVGTRRPPDSSLLGLEPSGDPEHRDQPSFRGPARDRGNHRVRRVFQARASAWQLLDVRGGGGGGRQPRRRDNRSVQPRPMGRARAERSLPCIQGDHVPKGYLRGGLRGDGVRLCDPAPRGGHVSEPRPAAMRDQ